MTPNALHFDNRFLRELPGDVESSPRLRQVEGALYSRVAPSPVATPTVIAYSADMLQALGLRKADVASEAFAAAFSGNQLLAGMQPWASNYGGHQFGNWAGQLGDGRAISLGEVVGGNGERWELQLKGAGPTPYSRGADGRAVLRSSVREFLCSEAMHHLGVSTTRALSLIRTGDDVVRDMFYDGHPEAEAGAIVCRAAPSFIRFGHFELPSSRGDLSLLRTLVDFTIARDFPHLSGRGETLYADWFAEVSQRTAVMVAHWMRVGFVHGVMNTDNMSILGLTIDYGPYGWIDNYDEEWTPNTTDAGRRRYRFGQQPNVAWWNLSRLAGALAPLFEDIAPLQAGLDQFGATYAALDRQNIAAKFGLLECRDDDVDLMTSLHAWLQRFEVDMTLFFRALGQLDVALPDDRLFAEAFYSEQKKEQGTTELKQWLDRYARRVNDDAQTRDQRHAGMQRVNPCYVLRNYLAQEAIDQATQGDYAGIHTLLELLRHPYDEQPGQQRYAAKRPDWAREKAGCSMLSCSS